MGGSCCRRGKRRRSSIPKKELEQCSSGGGLVDACSTPKGERYRIPEISSCPPAPKKRRMLLFPPPPNNSNSTTPHQIPPFFLPPDIDLFFYFALRGIPAAAAVLDWLIDCFIFYLLTLHPLTSSSQFNIGLLLYCLYYSISVVFFTCL